MPRMGQDTELKSLETINVNDNVNDNAENTLTTTENVG